MGYHHTRGAMTKRVCFSVSAMEIRQLARGKLALVAGILCLSLASCRGPQHLSTFAVTAAPDSISGLDWTDLATDARGDGDRADSADGRALAYYYDAIRDVLWFRLELYGTVDNERPAVSISIDVDGDQTTGISWYGANTGFTFDKMLSVGPLEPDGDLVRGYNGITNANGVSRREWINERQGVLTFFVDEPSRAYVVGCSRTDISPDLRRFNVIGSVGANARWNDDIGEQGYAAIDLDASIVGGSQ